MQYFRNIAGTPKLTNWENHSYTEVAYRPIRLVLFNNVEITIKIPHDTPDCLIGCLSTQNMLVLAWLYLSGDNPLHGMAYIPCPGSHEVQNGGQTYYYHDEAKDRDVWRRVVRTTVKLLRSGRTHRTPRRPTNRLMQLELSADTLGPHVI